MDSKQEQKITKSTEVPKNTTAEHEVKKVELTTKQDLLPLGSEVEMDLLKKEILHDTRTQIDIETNFETLDLNKILTLPEEKKQFEVFQKETFIFLHQLVSLNDEVVTPEDLKLKAGSLFFDPSFQDRYTLSPKAKTLYTKLQSLYGYMLNGSDAGKKNASLIFEHWNELIGQIQSGVGFAENIKKKIASNPQVLEKKKIDLPPTEKKLWDKLVENKGSIMTTAVIGLGVVGALTFISKLFGGKKEEKKEGGSFWTMLLGGGAILGAAGLTLLSGKNPFEMLTSFFGGEALKVVLENTLKPILGDELTTMLVTKLEGKVTPAEFKDAYQKDGLKGLGKLIVEKKIEFTEEEWKKISEKFGLPDFSGVKKLWKKDVQPSVDGSNNSKTDIQGEAVDKSKWIPAKDAMKGYKQDIQDALLPTAAFLKTQKTALKIAGTVFALDHFEVLSKVAANATGLTLDSSLKLAQLPFVSTGSFSLSAFFGLTGFILYKMDAAEKVGETLKLPPDIESLKKWLKVELELDANKQWLKEHKIQFIDSELNVAAEILSGKKHLKDYIGNKPMLFVEGSAEKAMNWFEQKPEQIVMNKNLMGLQYFADQLGIMGLDEGQDSSLYKPVIEKIKNLKNQVSTGKPLLENDVNDLKSMLTTMNANISIETYDGYVYWKKRNHDGVLNYGTLCIDPKLTQEQALEKAFRFVSRDSWEHGLEVVESKTSELRLLFQELHLEWKESEKIENALLRIMRKGGILVCTGSELVFTYAGQKFVLGPAHLIEHLWKRIIGIAKPDEFSAVDMIYDWADGLVPVTAIGLVGALSKGDINPFSMTGMGRVLMRSALYPLTGTVDITKNVIAPALRGEWKEIIENPRNRLRADFFERWYFLGAKYKNLQASVPFFGKKIQAEIGDVRNNMRYLYGALYNIKEGQRSMFGTEKFFTKAEDLLHTSGYKNDILEGLVSDAGRNLRNINEASTKSVLERIELALKKEKMFEENLKLQMKIPKTETQKIADLVAENEKIRDMTLEQFKVHLATVRTSPSVGPHTISDLDDAIKKVKWNGPTFDAMIERDKHSKINSLLSELSDAEKKIEESIAHAKNITDPAMKKAALDEIQQKIIQPFAQKKTKALQFILGRFEQLGHSSKAVLMPKISEYVNKDSGNIVRMVKVSKGRLLLMVAQVGLGLFLPEVMKQNQDPERDLFDFFSKFTEENMQYEAMQVLVDILPFAGTYSNFYSAATGKQAVFEAMSYYEGREIKQTVEMGDTMSRVTNALWGSVGLAADIATILALIPSVGASIPANLTTRLGVLVAKETMVGATMTKKGKVAKYFLENLPKLVNIASRIEGGWKTVFSKLFDYSSSSRSALLKKASSYQKPLFYSALGTTGASMFTYKAQSEMNAPEEIANMLPDVNSVQIKGS